MFKNRKYYLNDRYQKILSRLEYTNGKLQLIKEDADIFDSNDSLSEKENSQSESRYKKLNFK